MIKNEIIGTRMNADYADKQNLKPDKPEAKFTTKTAKSTKKVSGSRGAPRT